MNGIVLFTQRVEINESYGERRDAIDREIPKLLYEAGFLPVPMTNDENIAENILSELNPKGIFLSGGNSLAKYGGDAPERDKVEALLLDAAVKKRLPVFGICRGCQFVADYFGGELKKVEGHVRSFHKITGELARDKVNSFHEYGITNVKKPLIVTARAEDNTAEAIKHETLPIAGIMWHPERGGRQAEDMRLIRDWFRLSREAL